MIEPVKSASAPVNIAAPAKAGAQQTAASQTVVPAKVDAAKADTVQLSNEAQARALHQNGMSIPDIALQLKLDIKTVTDFFPLSKT